MLPLNSHPDGRIQCREKHGPSRTQGSGNAWLDQPASAVPRFRRATLDALLPESPNCTSSFTRSRSFDLDRSDDPSRSETGTVSQRHSPGVPLRDPLNPSIESPSDPSDAATQILGAVAEVWKLSTREARSLLPAVESALAHGWPAVDLTDHLIRKSKGARDPVRVLARRLTDLPQLRDLHPATVPWCGECEDAHSRTITVTEPDGTEAAQFCPQCSPQVHRAGASGDKFLQDAERW